MKTNDTCVMVTGNCFPTAMIFESQHFVLCVVTLINAFYFIDATEKNVEN